MQSGANSLGAERAELDGVLASGILGKSNYVVRLLMFVCEKYFEGNLEDIKEYSIAVNALGRSADFDPQVDTIVRVTAHTLRKRLEEYYRTDGADHTIHICIPAGRYVPNFIHKGGHSANGANENAKGAHPEAPSNLDLVEPPASALTGATNSPAGVGASKPSKTAALPAVFAVAACAALAVLYLWPRPGHNSSGSTQAAALTPVETGPSVRAMIGDKRKPYTDQAGFLWSTDKFCTGGDSFAASEPAIEGTGDPLLFEGGRAGTFSCTFPVPAGSYEMHLLFAETSDLQENARSIGYSIDGGPTNNLDVVDDSGADDTATAKIFTGVHPEADGAIHLDFTAAHSFVNAVEILPEPVQRPLPIRILAGRDTAYRDLEGRLWLPDRDFFGGRQSNHGSEVRGLADSGIYDGQRLGHFHYSIPVAAGNNYTVKLYFIERWFGSQNQNVGGVGSRVFDVSCNGTQLLKNFDITREAQNAPLVKTFARIQPTPQNKIEIYFTPNVNYPSVSAIEILPE